MHAGEQSFTLEGSHSFALLIRWPGKEGECGLKIDSSYISSAYEMFPPTLSGETYGKLGWIENGTLSLLITEKGVKTSVVTDDIPDKDSSIVPETDTVPVPDCGNWMEFYSDSLGKLKLKEMIIPGTHNSGTYDPVAVYPVSEWIRNQSLTIAEQLSRGIRCLDLRIGQNSPGDYVICHGEWRTNYTLTAALKEVTDFIKEKSTKEIVILDFHRFVNLGEGRYDFDQLRSQIDREVSGCVLPYANKDDTLETLWNTASYENKRIVLAWHERTVGPNMCWPWPGVSQEWYEDADSLEKLYDKIKNSMTSPPTNDSPELWATCSFMSGIRIPLRKADVADPTITNWFFGGSYFCDKANIIYVDFFEQHSTVVQASITGSLLIAAKK